MAWPRDPRPLRAYYSIFRGGTLGQTSGFSIEAPAEGKGAILFLFDTTAGNTLGGFIIEPATDPPILDTALDVVESPILSTYDPAQAPTVIVTRGRNSAGVVPSESAGWLVFVGPSSANNQRDEIFIPAGFRLTGLKELSNVSVNGILGLDEL